MRESRTDPEVAERVDQQEADAFAAFMGAHQAVQQRVGRGGSSA